MPRPLQPAPLTPLAPPTPQTRRLAAPSRRWRLAQLGSCLSSRLFVSCKHSNPGDRHGGTMLHEKRLKTPCVRRPQCPARTAPHFRRTGCGRTRNLHFPCVPGERRRGPRHPDKVLERPTRPHHCTSAPLPRPLVPGIYPAGRGTACANPHVQALPTVNYKLWTAPDP